MGLKRSHSGSDSSSASSFDSDSEVETRKRPIKNVYSSSDSKSSDEEEEWNSKPTKSKAKAKPTKKTIKPSKTKQKRSRKNDDDNDESNSDSDSDSGSASSSSSNSPPSKKRFDKEEGEVDFESDSSEEFNDGYDENLMGDEADQKMLAGLTETQREQELFNRSEQRELLRARFEIGRKLKKKKSTEPESTSKGKKEKKQKKKVSNPKENQRDDDDEEEIDFSAIPDLPSRSTERRRQIEDNRRGKAAIESLKAEREKKKLKQKLKAKDVFSDDSSDSDSGKDRKRRSSTSTSDSSSSSNDSDGEKSSRHKNRDRGRDSDSEHKEKFVMSLENLNSLLINRDRMQDWCFAPFFKDTVIGCFLRIHSKEIKNQPHYFIGEILSVVETGKTYELGKGKTNIGVKMRCPGVSDQVFRLEYISNQGCSEDEFKIYSELMKKHQVDFVTREHYEKKIEDLRRAREHRYTDADIDYLVKQKERFKENPNNFALRKSELMKEKIFAEQQNDHEKAIELGREIDRLEAEANKLESLRNVHIKSISYINERNRTKNILDGVLSNASGGHQAIADDPFTRRRCAPQIYTKNKHTDSQSEVKNANDKEDTLSVLNDSNIKKDDKKVSNFKPDDMFEAHNFEIKLDLPLANNDSSISNSILVDIGAGVFPKPTNSGPKIENNRRLNLEEYKRKKGLI